MTEESPPQRQPKATAAEVAACQFSSWYSTFRNMNRRLPDDHADDGSSRKQDASAARKSRRNNVTIESRILSPLPPEFLDYLKGDGVVLPTCARKVSSCMKNDVDVEEDDDWSSSDENDDAKNKIDDDSGERDNPSDDDDEDHPTMKAYHFPALTSQIQNAINELCGTTASGGNAGGGGGGGVLPKLNWSSPRDATWMNCGTLKCQTPGDVYLLLKSSEFVAFDLERAWEDLDLDLDLGDDPAEECQEKKEGNDDEQSKLGETKTPSNFRYELVLRKWCNLHPSMEFRCFVYEHELVAISQRHPSKFYNHLQHPSITDDHHNHNYTSTNNDFHVEHDKTTPTTTPSADTITPHPIATQIQKFFRTYIRHRFPNANANTSSFHKYVVDVYIDSQDRVWIIDFNVWADRTESLLFSWEELMELGRTMTDFKQNLAIHNNKEWKGHAHHDTESKEAETVSESDATTMIPPPEMRVVTRDMKSMTYDPLSTFRGPTDVMDLMGGNGGASKEFEEFMKQCVKPSEI